MVNERVTTVPASASSETVSVSTSSGHSTSPVHVPDRRPVSRTLRAKTQTENSIESAVYAHIRALRALGRTSVNTSEIAGALSLTVAQVGAAISNLQSKGVKVV